MAITTSAWRSMSCSAADTIEGWEGGETMSKNTM
jgi:hypothetical protein